MDKSDLKIWWLRLFNRDIEGPLFSLEKEIECVSISSNSRSKMWKAEKLGLKYVQAKSKENCKYVLLRRKKNAFNFFFKWVTMGSNSDAALDLLSHFNLTSNFRSFHSLSNFDVIAKIL